MQDNPLLDLALDASGEISVGADGDLLRARDADVVLQEIRFRLKTVRGDWALEPDCGADLELLIGAPNSRETGAQMEDQIAQALSHDGFLIGELTDLRVVPVSHNALLGLIAIDYGDETFNETVTLDLKEGQLG